MTTSSKPLLVSFNLCPYVQRSVIKLNHKQVDFDIEYIDLQNKPDWFLKISPLGKVPVLKVDDTVIFESAVINEYLDEVNPPSLHPADPLRKAHNRAWIEFGSGLFMEHYWLSVAQDEETFNQKRQSLEQKLAQVEAQLGEGPYFNGDQFSLVDTAYAPLFMRLALLEKAGGPSILTGKIRNWSEALLARVEVQKSVPDHFEELFLAYIQKSETYLKTLLQ